MTDYPKSEFPDLRLHNPICLYFTDLRTDDGTSRNGMISLIGMRRVVCSNPSGSEMGLLLLMLRAPTTDGDVLLGARASS
jgi:hypothetical protein